MICVGWEAELLDIVAPDNEKSGKEMNGQIQLAEMTGPTSCRIGKLELSSEDLLFSDRLFTKIAISVAGKCPGRGRITGSVKLSSGIEDWRYGCCLSYK